MRETIWEQLVQQKEKWIGGVLIEEPDMGGPEMQTEIRDITFTTEDGDTFFSVKGNDWEMEVNIKYLGISTTDRGDGFRLCMTFMGGSTWHILKKNS